MISHPHQFSRRWVLSLAVFWMAALGLAAPVVQADQQTRRPNLIVFIADDQRWDTLSCAGHPVIKTPHIDGLAQRGVRFRNVFATTSICAVSRACFLTGQYARRHGIHDFSKALTPAQYALTYPAQLRQAGYWTGVLGKWGVGGTKDLPTQEFDYFKAFPGQGRYYPVGEEETAEHLTRKMGHEAIEFLEQRPADRPFLLIVLFKAPHCQDGQIPQFPIDRRHKDLFAEDLIPIPRTATESHFQALPGFLQDSEARTRWKIRFANPEMYQSTVKDYLRLITGIDEVVGDVLAKVQEQHALDNTVVAYSADNGFYLGEHGLAGKWFMHEESIRLPMIVTDYRRPAPQTAQTDDQLVLNIDLAPTLLDAAGLPVPDVMQGRSLLPLMRGEKPKWRQEFFYEHLFQHPRIPATEGARDSRWKYVRYVNQEPPFEELFNLQADPYEEHNLAADSQHAQQLKTMRAKWQRLREESR